MIVRWSKRAYEEKEFWRKNNQRIYKKILTLLKDIEKTPNEGLGKPEPLKYQLNGFWSRRITFEHRLVYRVVDNRIEVVSCRYHYE